MFLLQSWSFGINLLTYRQSRKVKVVRALAFSTLFLPVRIFSLSLQVMGGKSTGTFNVENGLGIFDGEVVDVPFLKAPGFIKASVVDMNLGLLICGGEWC